MTYRQSARKQPCQHFEKVKNVSWSQWTRRIIMLGPHTRSSQTTRSNPLLTNSTMVCGIETTTFILGFLTPSCSYTFQTNLCTHVPYPIPDIVSFWSRLLSFFSQRFMGPQTTIIIISVELRKKVKTRETRGDSTVARSGTIVTLKPPDAVSKPKK